MIPSPFVLTARDFDAYLPEKASSNAFTRPRLEVKQRALAWARDVAARLAEQGLQAEVHATDEHPSHRNKRRVESQWVFFWRDAAARGELDELLERSRSIAEAIDDPSPYTRHAFLGLRLDPGAVEVGFAVHPEAKVDIDNLRARLAEGSEHLAEELTKALHALPDQFEVRAGDERGEAMRLPCSAATPEQIAEALARCVSENVPLWIGWRVPRPVALEHAEVVSEQLDDAVLALLPVYRLIAWSRDNDHIGIERTIEGLHEEQARAHAEVVALDEKWKAEQAAQRERATQAARARAEEAGPGRRPVTLATLFKSSPSKDPPKDVAKEPVARDVRPAPPRADAPKGEAKDNGPPLPRPGAPARENGRGGGREGGRDAGRPVGPRPAPKPRTGGHDAPGHNKVTFSMRGLPDASPKREAGGEPTWEKGARVGILHGPFAGKVGTIAEMEGARSARVLLGLLSARLDISSLTLLDAGAAAKFAAGASAEAAPRKAP